MTAKSVIRRLVKLMLERSLGARGDAACAAALELAAIGLGVAAPVLLKLAIDALASGAPISGPLTFYIAGFVIALAGTNATAAIKLIFTLRIVDRLARRLTTDAARSQLPRLARGGAGDSAQLQGALERLPFSLQIVIDGVIWRAAPLVLQTLISLAVLAALVPPGYAIFTALVLAAYGLAARSGAKQFEAAAKAANDSAASHAQTIGDILRNARRVVFNGNIPGELGVIAESAARKRAANERVARLIAGAALIQFAVLAAGLAALLIASAREVSAGAMTPGDFVLLQAYAFRLALPLGGFGYILRQAGPALANIWETMDLITPALPEPANAPPMPQGPADIIIDNIGFRYGDRWIVRNVSARIPAGAYVAITGRNGAGKSTLAQIIAGLLEPHEGDMTISGTPMSQISPEHRHRFALYAPQTTSLFNRSLRDNALYPPSKLTETELAALLNDWRFYEDGRPIDLDLPLGERGAKLSGGQIQKLELARISGITAPVVILDETTAALDRTSETRIITDLRKSFQNRTTLILITHRIDIANSGDLVIHVENGQVTSGTHNLTMNYSASHASTCGPASKAQL